MRVIAGTSRSRPLEAPAGLATRPTSDRLRETLFNVLAPRIENAHFLDLYAGSGAVGIEALSRGAAQVVFVEKAQQAIKILRANLDRLDLTAGFSIISGNAAAYLRKPQHAIRFDLVFLDPPYDDDAEYFDVLSLLGRTATLLVDDALVVAEHRRKHSLADEYGALRRTRLLQQGDAALSFYGTVSYEK